LKSQVYRVNLDRKTKMVEMNNSMLEKEEIIRNEVILEARKLFQQYGLLKTTMEDIAKAMQKGKSTLYYYYKSKDEIFEAVVNKEIHDVFIEMRSAVEKSITAEEKLRTYFRTSINLIKERALLYKIMKGEINENLKIMIPLRSAMDSNEVIFIKEILLFGIKGKEFIEIMEEDIDIMAYSVVSALRSITVDLVIENRFPSWDNRIGVLSEVFIRGLKR
jgi:AcrR family transcriptional regulator